MPVWAGLIWLHAPLAEPGLLTFGLATTLTLVVAALSWRFVERPANGGKVRFPFPRTARG
jgi:peptidoglycan/LPS O-acetylase OafA/YrhL